MKDISKLIASINHEKNPDGSYKYRGKQMLWRQRFCQLFQEELKTLSPDGRGLSFYLVDVYFDCIEPGVRIVLKFPHRPHIFDAEMCDGEVDRSSDGKSRTAV